jgi:hypothetical protein
MENPMVCAVLTIDGPVLIGFNPVSVFTTTAEHLETIPKKDDGHYDRREVMKLVHAGHAVMYDEKAVRAITRASEFHIFGCPGR